MKRMYVTLAVILIALVWAITSIGQMNSDQNQPRKPFNRAQRRMELREEMHRRMREKLLLGRGADQDLFKDLEQHLEESLADSFSGFDQLPDISSNFKSEWLETNKGRTLVITPKDNNQKINIDVNATTITIKGETVEKTATSSFSSAFTNSFPVPDDCDGTKVKMDSKDGKLLVVLPYRSVKAISQPRPEERKPLQPAEGDVQI